MNTNTDKILILGGGYAGVMTAARIARRGIPVTLIAARDGMLERIRLHQVAAGDDVPAIAYRQLFRNLPVSVGCSLRDGNFSRVPSCRTVIRTRMSSGCGNLGERSLLKGEMLKMATYKCRVDGEDLTTKVVAAASGRPGPVVRVAVRKVSPVTNWRVQVRCSQGHDNIFNGSGAP